MRPEDPVLPRIALIGPTLPYRGGIAQYTTELKRALQTRCELLTISFSRQYPAWLYPGRSDREAGAEQQYESGVDYVFDGIDPRTWSRVTHSIAAHNCRVVIITWWTLFLAPCLIWITRSLRSRGVKVIFLCHNLADHESGFIKYKIAQRLLVCADAFLVHSTQNVEQLCGWFPGKRVVMHVHPTYDRFPASTRSIVQRGRLELLFFGFIRPYKGLETLLAALAHLADNDVYLTVAGEPWRGKGALPASIETSIAPNVEWHLEYIDDAHVADFFARADLVVLPYSTATGSGVAALAHHFDRPILATRVGGLTDVVEEGRTGFIVDPGSPTQLASCLRAVNRKQLLAMRENTRRYKTRSTWQTLAEALLKLSRDLSGQPESVKAPSVACACFGNTRTIRSSHDSDTATRDEASGNREPRTTPSFLEPPFH